MDCAYALLMLIYYTDTIGMMYLGTLTTLFLSAFQRKKCYIVSALMFVHLCAALPNSRTVYQREVVGGCFKLLEKKNWSLEVASSFLIRKTAH